MLPTSNARSDFFSASIFFAASLISYSNFCRNSSRMAANFLVSNSSFSFSITSTFASNTRFASSIAFVSSATTLCLNASVSDRIFHTSQPFSQATYSSSARFSCSTLSLTAQTAYSELVLTRSTSARILDSSLNLCFSKSLLHSLYLTSASRRPYAHALSQVHFACSAKLYAALKQRVHGYDWDLLQLAFLSAHVVMLDPPLSGQAHSGNSAHPRASH